ncbi:cytochrome d ubiquinol oxidase subunit II [Methylobacterium sp. J-076]|uniref:cytochrome d ubiquinol oxidase subunit II n=1 Tax=Methylobacterium sp. J-076 TaxID=2836655 RepID=UPI001FB94DC8|nr:cytochrome d ubiquinol oxidase subunit II [Methylobacterium sp. J-076]MCJ2014746.1 cytochrome d ubiquinol oxidase subunit II [Methylobacterium sp. J-076]
MELDLPLIWAILIATAVFLYVAMDGFDLGLGILFPAVRGKAERDVMVNSVAPVWDGNETWLVLGGGGLLAVFPLAYATILPALYMPLILMLLALVFRGVAFEMRFRVATVRGQLWWDRAFSWGSYVATFCQGIALGAFVQGIKIEGRAYAGGWWDWLTPFSLLTGASLVVGYGLLGACWLIWKTNGELQIRAYRLAKPLGVATLTGIALISATMLAVSAPFRARWLGVPGMMVGAPVPILVGLLAWRFARALERRDEIAPFLCALGFFLLSYIGLGISMWPFIVPPSITIWQAATPPHSQAFLLYGAVVLVPLILTYTAYVYWLFRGKVTAEAGYH